MIPTLPKDASETKLKVEKGTEPLLPTELTMRPRLTGLKITVVFGFFLSLAALVGAGLLYQSLNTERREREALKAAQAEVLAKAQRFENEAGRYEVLMKGMREQLGNYVDERKRFTEEISRNQTEITELQTRIRTLEAQDQAFGEVSGPIFEPAASIEPALPAEPVQQAAPPPAPPKPEVLTVNRKFNFVVVNIGMKDGLGMGDMLTIEHEGSGVGKVQIEKLYDSFAAATIVEEKEKTPITVGDAVSRL